MRFRIRPIERIGTRHGRAFVDRADGSGGYEEITTNIYPPSAGGDLLRESRVNAGISFLGLRKAAARLGLKATQLSDLETGRAVFTDPGDFETAAEIVKGKLPRRADGWPLCPVCNEDELGCLDMTLEQWTAAQGNLAAYLARELFCYRCAHTYPPGTFSDAEVST